MNAFIRIAATLSIIAYQANAQTARFVPLGDLPGGENVSWATGLSADGQRIVGGSSSTRAYWGEMFLWTNHEGMQPVALLDGFGNEAAAISSNGRWITGISGSNAGIQAFAWSESTGIFGLGDLPGGEHLSEAYGVSNNGRVIVGNSASGAAGPGLREAFRWTPDEGMVGLGFLGGAENRKLSGANDVSADGSVIIGYTSIGDSNASTAFRWTEATGMVPLTDLPGGHDSPGASDLSADGRWIAGAGGGENFDGTFRTEAVLWHPDGTPEGLGILDRGMDIIGRSSANSISDDGSIVIGTAFSFEFREELFIWTRSDGMRPLEEFLLTDHGIDVDAMGWNLNYAMISGDGTTLAGAGTSINGGFHSEAWMVRLVPAPSSVAPLAVAGLLGVRRRR